MRRIALVLLAIFALAMLALPLAPAFGAQVSTVVYDPLAPGSGDDLRATRYLPASFNPNTTDTLPALMLVHGGAWTGGSRADFAKTADFWADAAGFAVFSIDYRLAAQWGPERLDGAQDVARAFTWIAAQSYVDPARVHALGTSAGAHLLAAAVLCDLSPVPNITPASAILFYCPSDLTTIPGYASVWGPDGATSIRQRMSPALHPRPGLGPTVHYHGDADSVVPVAQAVAFDSILDAFGNVSKIERRANGTMGVDWTHGFFKPNEPSQWLYSAGPPVANLKDSKSQYRWALVNLWGQWFGSNLFAPPLTAGAAPVSAP